MQLIAESISCDVGRFKALGIDVDGGSYWDLDRFSLYLLIRLGTGEQATQVVLEDGESVALTWAPWTQLSFEVFERDGENDILNPEAPRDDLRIGDIVHLQPRDFPLGAFPLSTEGVCTAELSGGRALPEWTKVFLSPSIQTP